MDSLQYYKLNSNDFIPNSIPKISGIYKIIALDENNIPISFNRFLGTDNAGILYIGKTENLYKRLNNMRRAFSSIYKSTNHIAARRYAYLNELENRMQLKFPVERLVINIQPCIGEFSAIQMEMKAFKEYENLFGERPPLNRQ